jgi:hypothetical protein
VASSAVGLMLFGSGGITINARRRHPLEASFKPYCLHHEVELCDHCHVGDSLLQSLLYVLSDGIM